MAYFVVAASQSTKDNCDVVLVQALNTRSAHDGVARSTRERRQLPSSAQVLTVTLHEAATEDEAIRFMDALPAKEVLEDE